MCKAVKFLPNRVWRVYSGGSGIDRMRGEYPGVDGHFPEDWIASTSLANNPQYSQADQGMSQVDLPQGAVSFAEYLACDPMNNLGQKHYEKFGTNAALLMKILDAAIQLPIQCHPTVPDAKRYFNSDFGKTEAWYVVATREIDGCKPYLLVGFNEKLDEGVFKSEARNGFFAAGAGMMHKLEVQPGDCLLIRGGLPHAIGCGVTLIEVMEPSDLVIQPEHFCGEQKLSESERWSNAAVEDALDCFAYRAETPEEIVQNHFMKPEAIDGSLQIVVPRRLANYFEVQKLTCQGSYTLHNREQCHRAGVVISGELQLDDGINRLNLPAGSAFFLPYGLQRCIFYGNGEAVFALPPAID